MSRALLWKSQMHTMNHCTPVKAVWVYSTRLCCFRPEHTGKRGGNASPQHGDVRPPFLHRATRGLWRSRVLTWKSLCCRSCCCRCRAGSGGSCAALRAGWGPEVEALSRPPPTSGLGCNGWWLSLGGGKNNGLDFTYRQSTSQSRRLNYQLRH